MRDIIVMAMAVLVVAVLCVHSTEAKEGPRCNNGLGSLGCNNGLGCKTGQDCVPPQGGQTGRPECRMKCKKPDSNPRQPQCPENQECRASNKQGSMHCMPKRADHLAGPSSTVAGDSANITTVAPTNAPTNVPTNVPTNAPTNVPTNLPTNLPTNAPTNAPTNVPTTEV